MKKLIQQVLRDSGLSGEEVASALGYNDATVLGAYLDGTMKLPVGRLPGLAVATGVDLFLLVRCWLTENDPDLLEILDGLPHPPLLTASERRFIWHVREFTEQKDAEIVIADGRDVLAFVMV